MRPQNVLKSWWQVIWSTAQVLHPVGFISWAFSLPTWTLLLLTSLSLSPISLVFTSHPSQKVCWVAYHTQHSYTLETAPQMRASIYVLLTTYISLLPVMEHKFSPGNWPAFLPFCIIFQEHALLLLKGFIYSIDSSLPAAMLIHPLNLCDYALQ